MTDNLLHDAARWYAEHGWRVYPKHSAPGGVCTCGRDDCQHPGKHPRVKGGAHAGTTDTREVDKWWRRWPDANVGVSTGGGLVVVDIDGQAGEDAVSCIDLPVTCEATSGRGRHLYYALDGPARSRNGLLPEVDVIADGHSITAPPSVHHSGRAYEWVRSPWDCPPAPAPRWVVEACAPEDRPPMPPIDESEDEAHIDAYVSSALESEVDRVRSSGPGQRNHDLNRSAYALGQLVGGGVLSEQVAIQRLELAAVDVGLTTHEARQTISSGLRAGRKAPRKVPAPQQREERRKPRGHEAKPKERRPTRDWRDLLIYSPATQTRPERVAANTANVVTTLTRCPEWEGVVGHDDFAIRITIRRDPPWDELDAPQSASRPGDQWEDGDTARLHAWLERNHGVAFSGDAVQMGLIIAAHRQSWNPVRDYLTSATWDGTRRLDSWLAVYVGAEDGLYQTLAGRWWLISAVARVMDPGCKADHVLILEGSQGIGKSSALAILAGEWFTDSPIELGSKEAQLALSGRWIVELGELDSLSRAASSRAKAFFSSSVDHVRPPYGRHQQERRRQCVFAGSVNPDGGYLTDITGARRYWPVACGAIDLDALRRDRDQLWAEALHEYQDGARWWPSDDDERELFASVASDRQTSDVWHERIESWVANRTQAPTTGEVLAGAVDLDPSRQTRREESRARAVLTALGYTQERSRRADGTRPRVWVRDGAPPVREQMRWDPM